MKTCPYTGQHCGHVVDEEKPAVTVQQLEAFCRENGYVVLPGGRVSESVAAAILGLACGTLRNMRSSGRGPAVVRAGGGRGRVSYRLQDLSDYMKLEN